MKVATVLAFGIVAALLGLLSMGMSERVYQRDVTAKRNDRVSLFASVFSLLSTAFAVLAGYVLAHIDN